MAMAALISNAMPQRQREHGVSATEQEVPMGIMAGSSQLKAAEPCQPSFASQPGIGTMNLPLLDRPSWNNSCPSAVPSPLPSDGRGEDQGEVRVHGEDPKTAAQKSGRPRRERRLPNESVKRSITP